MVQRNLEVTYRVSMSIVTRVTFYIVPEREGMWGIGNNYIPNLIHILARGCKLSIITYIYSPNQFYTIYFELYDRFIYKSSNSRFAR